MSQLKLASTTRSSLPRMQSTERTNGEFFPLLAAVLTMIIIIYFIVPIQERYHCLKPLGIHISIAEFDENYGVGLSIPQASDEDVTPCLQTITPLTYLPL